MLRAESISVAYESRQVLHDIYLDLIPGQVLGVIGPNGSGKSTLVRALSGVLPLQSGSVFINGKDILHLPVNLRARLISVVPQAGQIPLVYTAWETVLFGRTPYLNWFGLVSARDELIARKALARTDSQDLAKRPMGELSSGEQQRVLLARAIAQATPVLLLDEPTSHLDLHYQINLLELVRSLAHQENLAVLLVVHDLNLVARYTDRIALLVDGRFDALGSPAEVLNPGLLSRVYQVPLKVLSADSKGTPFVVPV